MAGLNIAKIRGASIKKGMLIFLGSSLLISIFLPCARLQAAEDKFLQEDETVIYKDFDPAEDDHGPGDYLYPRHEVFSPGEGLFDIKMFLIIRGKENYRFIFEFGEITDPWEGHNEFSHQLIHLYVDTGEGGQEELFRPGAGVSLAEEHPWNYHLRISGWWLRLMEPEDDPRDLIRDLEIDAETSPWDVKEGEVDKKGNFIIATLPHEKISSLPGSYFYLFVGSFDPFGEDYFRDVESEPSSWSFAAPDRGDVERAPRVIDWFYPREGYQEKILSDFSGAFPELTPLKIPSPEEPDPSHDEGSGEIYALFMLGIGLLIAAAIIAMITVRGRRDIG